MGKGDYNGIGFKAMLGFDTFVKSDISHMAMPGIIVIPPENHPKTARIFVVRQGSADAACP